MTGGEVVRGAEQLRRSLERLGLHFRRPGKMPGGRWAPYRIRTEGLPPQFAGGAMKGEAVIVSVPLAKTTASPGFSYAPDGWHPYVATLKQYVSDPELPFERSSLGASLTRFLPTTAHDVLLAEVSDPVHPLDRLPPRLSGFEWTVTRREVRSALRGRYPEWMRHGKRVFGPVSPAKAVQEYDDLIRVYHSIRSVGLRADLASDPIRGYFMVREDDYRFVLTGGQHRVAALRVLGVEEVTVHLDWPIVVPLAHIDRWCESHSGPYPMLVARLLFDKLFSEKGLDKARFHGLV